PCLPYVHMIIQGQRVRESNAGSIPPVFQPSDSLTPVNPARLKELLQQEGALFRQHSRHNIDLVIQALVGQKMIQTIYSAALAVPAAVYKPAQAGVHYSPCTHNAGLFRYIQRCIGRTPIPYLFGSGPQYSNLGMGGRIKTALSFVK